MAASCWLQQEDLESLTMSQVLAVGSTLTIDLLRFQRQQRKSRCGDTVGRDSRSVW